MAANEDIRAERQRGPEPYDEEPEDDFVDDEPAPRRSGRVLPIVVASLAIFGFVVIVYYAYQQGIRAGTEQNPPIIKAEEGPSKVRPASPGGMEVPNQGMKVYELGKPGAQTASTGGVERILPKPEEPMPRPPAPPEAATAAPAPATTPPAPTTPVTPAPMAQAVPASTAAAPPVLPAPPAAGQTSAAPAASAGVVAPPPPPLPGSGQPMPAVADAAAGSGAAARPAGPAAPAPPPPAQPPRDDAQAPARGLVLGGRAPAGATPQSQSAVPGAPGSQIAAAPAAQMAPAKPSAAGNFAVQLRAARSEEEANQVMQAALRKYADILSAAGQQVRQYTDSKGVTYHRVLVGSFANRNEAQSLCNDLKSRGQDCFVQTLK